MQLRKYFAALFAALLLTGASATNAALTPIDVTWNPSGAGLSSAGAFTFDDVVLNSYLTIDITGNNFTDNGFLKLSVFLNNGAPTAIPNAGFPGSNTPYTLYVQFTGTGTQTPGIPSTGTFNSLSYSLIGTTGITNFIDSNADGIFEISGGGAPVVLATGSLLTPGSTSLTADPVSGLLLPASQVTASFIPNAAFPGFFVNPSALTELVVSAAFTSTGTVIRQFQLGNTTRLSVDGGGGNATFSVTAIPEPDTYGMLLAGLGLFGFIARRKAKRETV
jgi:hypothetical protein